MSEEPSDIDTLIRFLTNTMSMTEVYQPVVIRELVKNGGTQSKDQLAKALSEFDASVLEYYKSILMRWPKATLTKHGIVDYDRQGKVFRLLAYPDNAAAREQVLKLCDEKIAEWIARTPGEAATGAGASVRFLVLKAAHGKCQLCGMPSSLRPIDVDHIIPRSKADKKGRVLKDGRWIDLHSIENLQALCFECNRSKRDTDDTDFRPQKKLVRDKIPAIIAAEGRSPVIESVNGRKLAQALADKLIEEHAEFIAADVVENKIEELTDIVEVAIALGRSYGLTEAQFMRQLDAKRTSKGGFEKGYLYSGDAGPIERKDQ
jgi:predicted house-cleaning noncanonical NTP pyrophosphatase (MazG superfamily)